MKRTRESSDVDDAPVMVSKKQIIEDQSMEKEVIQSTKPKSFKNSAPPASVSDEEQTAPPEKSSRARKTPKKLPSTTPRKKADRTIYAPSIDSRAMPDEPTTTTTTTTPVPSNIHVVKEAVVPDEKREDNQVEKKAPVTIPFTEEKGEPTSQVEQSFGLLHVIDMSLLGASWFLFGMISVWVTLSLVEPAHATTLEARVLAIFEIVTNSCENFFVVELTSFFVALLAFHFSLTLIMNLIDDQN